MKGIIGFSQKYFGLKPIYLVFIKPRHEWRG